MKFRTGLTILGASALFVPSASALQAGGNGADNGIHDTKKVTTAECINSLTGEKEGTFTYAGPKEIWPPNHKYRTAVISLQDEDSPIDEPADTATIAVVGTHDQILADGSEMNGAGNTDPATDVVPGAPGTGDPAETTVRFRGERSGRELDGRTYTFTANGTVDNGLSTCEPVQFTAVVPHDQRNQTNTKPNSKRKKASAKRRAARR